MVSSLLFRSLILVPLLAIGGGGCDQPLDLSDAGSDAGDAGTDAGDAGTDAGDAEVDGDGVVAPARPLQDLGAITEPGGFYDHPYPSDLRLTAEGAPDLTNFYEPTPSSLLAQLRADVARDIRRFSPSAGVYLRFTAPLDPGSLPADVAASLEPSASVYLVDVDPASEGRGERWPAEVTYYAAGGRYYRPDMVVVRPPFGQPLRPATTYAAVVTSAVRSADGQAIERAERLSELLEGPVPEGREAELAVLHPLLSLADEGEVELARVMAATVFTTSDDVGDMRRLRQWVYDELPAPEVRGWERLSEPGSFALYRASFDLTEFLAGEPPYFVPGDGVILFDEERRPIPARVLEVRFTLTVPPGEPPPGGWPTALYAHGAGGSASGFVDDEGTWAAGVGVAMLSIDNPMHGDRNPEGGSFVDYLVDLATTNLVAGRDMYRHGIVDQVQLARLVCGGLEVPAEVSHSGAPIGLSCDELMFVGHSMGSQIGTMVVAVEPLIRSAFISEGGGGAAAGLVLRKANGVDIEALVALVLGIDLEREPLSADHPVVGLVIQTLLDPADPLSYAYGAIREPWDRPVSIVMTEGLEDDQTLPPTIEALAAAFGLPVVEPVAQPSVAHALWGIESMAPPLVDNVILGPEPVTGGLLQFAGQGHYALYREELAQQWYRGWLESAATGQPTIIDVH